MRAERSDLQKGRSRLEKEKKGEMEGWGRTILDFRPKIKGVSLDSTKTKAND